MRTLSKLSISVGTRLDHDRKSSVKEVRLKWPGALLTGFLISIALCGTGLCNEGDKRSYVIGGGEHEATLVPDLKGTAADEDLLFPLQVILKKIDKKDHCVRNGQIIYPYYGKKGLNKVPVKISLKKGFSPPSKAGEREISKGKASVISPVTRNVIEINAEIVKEDEFRAFKEELPEAKRDEVDKGLSPRKHWISFIMEDPEKPATCMEVIILHKGFAPKK